MQIRSALLLSMGCLTASFFGCKNSVEPTPPARGKIVFVDGQRQISVVNDNGTGLKKLATGDEIRVSPDGQSVLYTARGEEGIDLFVVGIDGSGRRNLTNTLVSDTDGTWSPEASRIAFQSGPDGSCNQIWIMKLDGFGLHQVTTDTASFHFWPRWAPDGEQIAFTWSLRDPGSQNEVHLINTDGTGERTVASPGGLQEWSPDGTMLTFLRDGTIHLVRRDGTGLRPLVPDEPDAAEFGVCWSPDGRELAFGHWDNGTTNIWRMNPDGSGRRSLTDFTSGSARSLSWSPDGERIAFSHEGAVHVMQADGTELRKITEEVGASEVHWLPEGK